MTTTELVRHSVAEEQYLYPTARRVLPDGEFQQSKKMAPTRPHRKS